MKTKMFIMAAALLGGMLLASCSKDNALLNDSAAEQSLLKDDNDDAVSADVMRNYPDPFYNITTIEYMLERTSLVTLEVFKEGTDYGLGLVHEYQGKGLHTVKFNAAGLEPGTYIAELKIGSTITKEKMYKKDFTAVSEVEEGSDQ